MVVGIVLACLLAAGLALTLAVLLQKQERRDPILVSILILEAFVQLVVAASTAYPDLIIVFIPAVAGLAMLALTYLVLVSRLDSPVVRFARSPLVRRVFAAVLGLALVSIFGTALATALQGKDISSESDDWPTLTVSFLTVFLSVLLVSLVALVGSLHAWRRAPRGSAARHKAAAFALAFGTRDVLVVGSMLLSEASVSLPRGAFASALDQLGDLMWPLSTIVFVPLLTYGILRSQLFDLDLKVKVGISRGTVVTVGLIVVLAAAKVAEFYLSRTYGFVAAGIAAGTMLVVTPRLNKMGDKVANAAMPSVQPTPAYVQFKKLEVYRAAVEAAHETGGIDDRQRATLDRLRQKLGLAVADTQAMEAEVGSTLVRAPAAAPA